MPFSDHLSQAVASRFASLATAWRRGTLLHAMLQSLFFPCLFNFSLLLKLAPKRLDIESLSGSGLGMAANGNVSVFVVRCFCSIDRALRRGRRFPAPLAGQI